jgi:hypothetical protein
MLSVYIRDLGTMQVLEFRKLTSVNWAMVILNVILVQ